MRKPSPLEKPGWQAVAGRIDEVLARLPSVQREVVVGLYLEGCTRSDLAAALGVPEGTVASRSNAALEKLRALLGRRGVRLSAAGLGSLLLANASAAEVPASLASLPAVAASFAAGGAAGAAGVPAAAKLAEGTLKVMLWAKVKAVAAVACAATVLAGAATVGVGALPGGRTYYLAPGGAEGSPGTLEKPFGDPLEAAALLEPGDTLYFRSGTYRCRTDRLVGLAPARSGRPGRPIAFKVCPGEHAVIDGSGSDWGFTPNGRSHVIIDGFEIRNRTGYGVKISAGSDKLGPGSHVTVRNCRIIDTEKEGVFAWETPNVLVENCLTSGSRTSQGVSIQHGCDGAVVRRVTSEGNALNGIKVRGLEGMLVELCLVRNNGRGLEVAAAQNCTFRNNVIFGNAWRGPLDSSHYEVLLEGGGKDVADPACRDNLFERNTVANPGGAERRLKRLVQVNAGCTRTTFRNNVFYVKGRPAFGFYGDCLEGHVFADNCVFSTAGQQVYVGGGVGALSLSAFAGKYEMKAAGNVFADPLFAGVATGDLRLEPGSPAQGRGAALPAGCSPPEALAPAPR